MDAPNPKNISNSQKNCRVWDNVTTFSLQQSGIKWGEMGIINKVKLILIPVFESKLYNLTF